MPTFSIPTLCILMILANRLVVMELKKILRKKYFPFFIFDWKKYLLGITISLFLSKDGLSRLPSEAATLAKR